MLMAFKYSSESFCISNHFSQQRRFLRSPFYFRLSHSHFAPRNFPFTIWKVFTSFSARICFLFKSQLAVQRVVGPIKLNLSRNRKTIKLYFWSQKSICLFFQRLLFTEKVLPGPKNYHKTALETDKHLFVSFHRCCHKNPQHFLHQWHTQ